MLLSLKITVAALAATAFAGLFPADEVDNLATTGLSNWATYLAKNPAKGNCTLDNAAKRYEWSDLSVAQREDYINAVLCLQSKPAKVPSSTAPGAKSRYDDYVALHITNTTQIHMTANFLAWHRYYIWTYEQDLRNMCGYKGYIPYWNWNRYASDPLDSSIFNGNASSMGGNGAAISGYNGITIGFGTQLPNAGGGGCVTEGPFANLTVNLGPMAAVMPNVKANPQSNGLGYNPRCLRRDVSKYSAAYTAVNYTYSLITGNSDISDFQNTMQGVQTQSVGVHSGGHFTIGGDPGGDFYTSPGDPAFFLHHGMIDRVWWIWQSQDLANRLNAIAGTITMMNQPSSRNGQLSDVQDFLWLGPSATLGDLLTTMGGNDGQFCYQYV